MVSSTEGENSLLVMWSGYVPQSRERVPMGGSSYKRTNYQQLTVYTKLATSVYIKQPINRFQSSKTRIFLHLKYAQHLMLCSSNSMSALYWSCEACWGWVLIWVNFDPIQEIEPKVGGGLSFKSGHSFVRLRYILAKCFQLKLHVDKMLATGYGYWQKSESAFQSPSIGYGCLFWMGAYYTVWYTHHIYYCPAFML